MRRSVIKGALMAGASGVLSAGRPPSAPRTGRRPSAGTRLSMRWLGVAGWELSFAGRSILFDPYLSRMPYARADGSLDPALPLRFDREAVERVAAEHLTGAPELVLVSHGHFDHLADVPQLLDRPQWRKHRVRTLCDETSGHLLAAMGVGPERMADVVTVRGGEYLQFDGFTVEVFRSLHSQQSQYGYFAPGRLLTRPARPRVLGDLVEGETLMYQVSVDNGPSVLLSGASNFAARELAGIRPDVAVVGMTSHSAVHHYLERLLSTLGDPPVLLPSHHDDMTTPLNAKGAHALADPAAAESLSKAAAERGSLYTDVLTPRPLEAFDITV
ncbi:MBL fold metallo-hydrolase [Streptomyces sp. LN785]|uniref:MBL fold metallo-hydrolase n=1 Tax=Streptomyces sp. LN785 TaxID=3112983 RepID=UPI0037171D29